MLVHIALLWYKARMMQLTGYQRVGMYGVHVICSYHFAGNFGGKIFWRIAENMSFGGIYFGG